MTNESLTEEEKAKKHQKLMSGKAEVEKEKEEKKGPDTLLVNRHHIFKMWSYLFQMLPLLSSFASSERKGMYNIPQLVTFPIIMITFVLEF